MEMFKADKNLYLINTFKKQKYVKEQNPYSRQVPFNIVGSLDEGNNEPRWVSDAAAICGAEAERRTSSNESVFMRG